MIASVLFLLASLIAGPFEALDQKALYRLMRQEGLPIEQHMTNAEMIKALRANAPIKAARETALAAKKAQETNDAAPKPTDPKFVSNAKMTVKGGEGLTQQAMPYLQGIAANMVNPNHQWIKSAVAVQMPLKAGISGTTHRFLGLGELLGVGDKPGMRLAMLGHLQEIEAHSFWEIVDAAGMGDPQKGKYVPFAPVTDEAMEAAAKQSLTTDLKGQGIDGPKDLETQIKRVLGLPVTETK